MRSKRSPSATLSCGAAPAAPPALRRCSSDSVGRVSARTDSHGGQASSPGSFGSLPPCCTRHAQACGSERKKAQARAFGQHSGQPARTLRMLTPVATSGSMRPVSCSLAPSSAARGGMSFGSAAFSRSRKRTLLLLGRNGRGGCFRCNGACGVQRARRGAAGAKRRCRASHGAAHTSGAAAGPGFRLKRHSRCSSCSYEGVMRVERTCSDGSAVERTSARAHERALRTHACARFLASR